MKNIVRALLIAGALTLPTTAIAQTAEVSFIRCSWDLGDKAAVYRVSKANWSTWNADAWQWNEWECEYGEFSNHGERYSPGRSNSYPVTENDELKCNIVYDDSKFRWELNGRKDLKIHRSPESGLASRVRSSFDIDRQTGKAAWDFVASTMGWGTLPSEPREIRNDRGTCERTTDPSLRPKPAPKL